MKKLKFPTPYTVLMLVIILAASLTFLLPSGAYNTLQYNKANDTFVIHTSDSTYALPATQEQLKDLGINIQLSKFKEEKIRKPISIPNTYVQSQPHYQGAPILRSVLRYGRNSHRCRTTHGRTPQSTYAKYGSSYFF